MQLAKDIFRNRVRAVLEQRQETIASLAERSNTPKPNMSRILMGRENVTLSRAERIANALGMELAELLIPQRNVEIRKNQRKGY